MEQHCDNSKRLKKPAITKYYVKCSPLQTLKYAMLQKMQNHPRYVAKGMVRCIQHGSRLILHTSCAVPISAKNVLSDEYAGMRLWRHIWNWFAAASDDEQGIWQERIHLILNAYAYYADSFSSRSLDMKTKRMVQLATLLEHWQKKVILTTCTWPRRTSAAFTHEWAPFDCLSQPLWLRCTILVASCILGRKRTAECFEYRQLGPTKPFAAPIMM